MAAVVRVKAEAARVKAVAGGRAAATERVAAVRVRMRAALRRLGRGNSRHAGHHH